MKACFENSIIRVYGTMSYNELKYLLDELTSILLTHRYKPVFYFEGSPVIGSEGFTVIIKLERPLSESDRLLLKKLMSVFGVEICGGE